MMNLLINADEAQKSKKGDLKGEKGPHQDSILLKAEPILGKDTRKIIRSLHSPSKFKEKLNILPNHTYLHLIIMDHGVGIKEKDKEMVFAPFYTKKEHGTGLGLVICASLVKKMNGLIGFTSKFGDGTKFHLFIPEVLKKE